MNAPRRTSVDSREELTLDQAASEFRVSRRTLERLRQSGALPGVRVGRHLHVRQEDVRRAIAHADAASLRRNLLSPPMNEDTGTWSSSWIDYLNRVGSSSGTTTPLIDWWTTIARQHSDVPAREFPCGDAAKAGIDSTLDVKLPILHASIVGQPEDRPLLDVLRELDGAFNPLSNRRI